MAQIIGINALERHFVMGEEEVRALRGISFSIEQGEFTALMGASGSGKSTLLNILGCLDRPSHGHYTLHGVAVEKLSRDELAEIRNKKIGFVFQSFNLLNRTTALENVELPLFYNRDIPDSERRERAEHALELVGLSDRRNHTPARLSGGQQQRVAIARALVNEPILILADEATGNLDTRTSFEVMALFQKLNEAGKTILFVTHETDIASFCSRKIRLRDGHIIEDAPQEATSAMMMLHALPKGDDYL